jgi:Gpi18-like mannosyltransferase
VSPKQGGILPLVLWSWLASRLLFFLTLVLAIKPKDLATLSVRLGRWDADHYLSIAREGYKGNDFAFFPLFPYTTRVLSTLLHLPPLPVALVLANGAFLVALLVLHRLTQQCFGVKAAQAAVLLTCLNPMAIFFAVPYTESFYLLLTGLALASLLHRPTLVGPVGLLAALSAATRPSGVVIVVSVLAFLAYWLIGATSLVAPVCSSRTRSAWSGMSSPPCRC